jgi:type VI secretion system protein ImpH
MAGTDRTTADRLALFRALAAAPHEFSFFQALRRLEATYSDQPRIGRSLRPQEDAVRLGQNASLAFAPATIAAFDPGTDGKPPRITVWFGGMFGPDGPLPLHLTEYARDRIINAGDPTFARFLDLFHHRLLSLVYRAWADAQPTAQFDRPGSDRFANYIGSLIGIGMPSLQDRDAMPDLAKLFFAGRFVCQARHAEGLQAMLAEFFDLPIQLVEFVGQWLRLPADCRCVLGGQIGGQPAAQLGVSATIGDNVWNCQTRFRLVAGPMSLADYCRLLPGGASLATLVAIVKNYVGLELDWDLNLILRRAEVPQTQLGALGQLGWTTWLVSQPAAADAGDLVLGHAAA